MSRRLVISHSNINTHQLYTGLQNFSQKCPLFGFWLISTNFGPLILNPKFVFGYRVRILQCCQFCVFRLENQIFEIFKNLAIFFFWKLVTNSWRHWNCERFAKKFLEIGPLVQEILLANVRKNDKIRKFSQFFEKFFTLIFLRANLKKKLLDPIQFSP